MQVVVHRDDEKSTRTVAQVVIDGVVLAVSEGRCSM